MKAYLIITGAVFGLLGLMHLVRAIEERARMAADPGYFFGMAESGWLVVGLLAPEAEFRTGVTGLVNYFRTHQGGNSTCS